MLLIFYMVGIISFLTMEHDLIFVSFVLFLNQGVTMQLRLAWNSLCSPGYP
jgi:hypothetical protein